MRHAPIEDIACRDHREAVFAVEYRSGCPRRKDCPIRSVRNGYGFSYDKKQVKMARTPGEGEDGGVPPPVPFRDRVDDVGAGSNNGSEAIAGSKDDGGAVLCHAEDSGAEHLPRGGGMERKAHGNPRSSRG